jgi:hypothetical protein
MYINDILSEWNMQDIKRVKITRNGDIKLHFADDQVVMAESETFITKVCTLIRKYNIKIWTDTIKEQLKQWHAEEEILPKAR